ncbi:MAG: NAD(P)H-hydrate dehydratase [Alphaproteobacteria bacterium]|nr:NAD(P)H-hydrate dehydratase [Alphaproteobacteria bacterium]
MKHELLTVEEIRTAEKTIIAEGFSEESLRERAGQAVVEVILQHFSSCHTVVFCGPGKNGGDGFVVARLLKEMNWPVEIMTFKDLSSFETVQKSITRAELIVDGLFGVGLSSSLEGYVLKVVELINAAAKPVVSIDVPSGIESNSGACLGVAIWATYTVTFWRARPGHYLLPGRLHAGKLYIKDIGIPDRLLPSLTHSVNSPFLWNASLQEPQPFDHKYTRGACLVLANGGMPGAIRLASLAARRVGAGLLRLICKQEEYPIFATAAWGEIVTPLSSAVELLEWIKDDRFNALLWGTGALPKDSTREQALLLLASNKSCVLDGGALSSFAGRTQELISHLHQNAILTPHEGEFHCLFPHLAFLKNKAEKTHKAAIEAQAVIVLKGYDTIIASPQGKIIINANAPATLATAGSGDVLAGLMAGLLAQGLAPFQAAAAAVWIQGEAANRRGLGLIAEDLLSEIPPVLQLLSVLRSRKAISTCVDC